MIQWEEKDENIIENHNLKQRYDCIIELISSFVDVFVSHLKDEICII